MVSRMAVLGSCATRDIFNSQINPNYKDHFKLITASERTSIISLMSNPVNIWDLDSLNTYSGEDLDYFGTKTLKRDFTKEFLLELKNNVIDYLILDNLFEARFGILCFENNIITNNSWDLHNTLFYKNLGSFNTLSMASNSKKYLKLYSKSFSLFYDYIKEECGDINLILNKACDTDRVLDDDGSIKVVDSEYCNEFNHYIYKLNKHIEDNYDVDIIELNILNYPNDVNHIWGSGTSHYIPEYYRDFTKNINNIINNHNYLNNLNKIISDQENEIIKLRNTNNWPFKKDLIKFNTARIDFKNYGSQDNTIEFLYISDADAVLEYPNWFIHDDGIGAVIESFKGILNLKIRCINDGKLNIRLRGIDAKDKNKRRIPIFIDFSSLEINGKKYIEGSNIYCHDDYYQCDVNVYDGDIVFVHIEWSPFKI